MEWSVENGTGWRFEGHEQVCESFADEYNAVMRAAVAVAAQEGWKLKSTTSDTKQYFCSEPRTDLFSIAVNQDVIFCPCYRQIPIGNLEDSSMREVWNAPVLVQMREMFARGELPKVCEGQLCPVVLGESPGG